MTYYYFCYRYYYDYYYYYYYYHYAELTIHSILQDLDHLDLESPSMS